MYKKWIYILMCLLSFVCYGLNENQRVAFYYGFNPPFDELQAFQWVVVHPYPHFQPKTYQTPASELFAYVSVGEVSEADFYHHDIQTSWIVGENKPWKSRILDLSSASYRAFLIDNVFKVLGDKGYRGFFLDTLDSYFLLGLTKEQQKAYQDGLIALIKEIKNKHPKVKIILNRGFEIIDKVHKHVDAVAAESLYQSWNQEKKVYQPVSETDRKWLLSQLNPIKMQYDLPVIAIDYIEPKKREKARKTAKKIASHGFIPWVSDPGLTTLGIGTIEIIPRKILIAYDEKQSSGHPATNIFFNSTFPLEFMGFIPVLHPINDALPTSLKGQYAGAIIWLESSEFKQQNLLKSWVAKQISDDVPIALMQNLGIKNPSFLLKKMGIKVGNTKNLISHVSITHQHPLVGYEGMPAELSYYFSPLKTLKGEPLLQLKAKTQEKTFTQDAIAITPWGGYALSPFVMLTLPDNQERWVINPFLFYKKALRLPDFPVPDVTTENGRRILTIHIDGDGFINEVPFKEYQLSGAVILEEILKKYPLPTMVSLIQREFELLNGEKLKSAKQTAKEIYQLPWIGIATHTYSHPFKWYPLEEGKPNTQYLGYPDKDYLFSYEKEVLGSTRYINQQFAPPNKEVKAIFWSGDAALKEEPLKQAYEAGLKNINGMAQLYLPGSKSLSQLNALGIKTGDYLQVFSPIANDYNYTYDWTKALYLFQNVIETFKLTESPLRFKPISIYYHFYSGQNQAALNALRKVHDWASKQYSTPLFITDYIGKVEAFYRLTIAKDVISTKPRWLVANNHPLREFRWPVAKGYPDFEHSENIIGFITHHHNDYIHTGPAPNTWFTFSQKKPQKPYIIDANGIVLKWQESNNRIIFSLHSEVPLEFKLGNMENYILKAGDQILQPDKDGLYRVKDAQNGSFEIYPKKN